MRIITLSLPAINKGILTGDSSWRIRMGNEWGLEFRGGKGRVRGIWSIEIYGSTN